MTAVKMKCFGGPFNGRIVTIDDYEQYRMGMPINFANPSDVPFTPDMTEVPQCVPIVTYIFKGDRLVYDA